jgi:hypothetical protein
VGWSSAGPARSASTATRCAAATAPGTATTTATALTRPDTLLAGEQAVAVHTPAPDDELLAAELARLNRKHDAVDAERRRLADLYQAGLIELPELQRRAADIDARRQHLADRRDTMTAEREQLGHNNQLRHRVRDFAHRVLAAIDHLDFDQKQNYSDSSSRTSTSPAGTSRSTYASRSTTPPHPHHYPAQTTTNHPHRQLKTVCVPLVTTKVESHRLAEAIAGGGVALS